MAYSNGIDFFHSKRDHKKILNNGGGTHFSMEDLLWFDEMIKEALMVTCVDAVF